MMISNKNSWGKKNHDGNTAAPYYWPSELSNWIHHENYCMRLDVEQKSSYFPITDVHFLTFKSRDG